MIRALLLAMAIPGLAFASEPRMPFDVGGAFDLLDQHGNARTQVDPDGRAQLLFFGYANCPGICATAMPMIADITFALADAGIAVRPVMITVDPERDQVGNMDGPLLQLHPEFVGLTGTEAALETAYKAFSVKRNWPLSIRSSGRSIPMAALSTCWMRRVRC